MSALFRQLLADERGQDLIEYALLSSFVALVCVAGLDAIKAAINNAYGIWGNNTNNIWQTPDPQSSGS
jgi:Flp pilus assembly pilin Flp